MKPVRTIDVVVIGGSLAGAACARELVRYGIDAVAFERDGFPRPKVCGGFLSPNAVDSLERLGLLETVRCAGAVEADHTCIHADGQRIDIRFRRSGLGISRSALDHILAAGAPVEQNTSVESVVEETDGFVVVTNREKVRARVVVDAAGKLSRFTRRHSVPEFGVQYIERGTRGSSLDFWFFNDGYGGAVTVEGVRSNFCFLIKKDSIGRYLSKPGRLVTGPLAYDRAAGDVIAIGDAAGMIEPFCGEGMHHALDSGILAAAVIAQGLRDNRSYAELRQAYQAEWERRWSRKRLLARWMRAGVAHPWAVRLGLGWKPHWFLSRLWATIAS